MDRFAKGKASRRLMFHTPIWDVICLGRTRERCVSFNLFPIEGESLE